MISSWLVKASEADRRAPEPERTVLWEHGEQRRSSHHHTPLPGAPLGGPGSRAIQYAVHATSTSHQFLPKVLPGLTRSLGKPLINTMLQFSDLQG